jgi:hypothetical protein
MVRVLRFVFESFSPSLVFVVAQIAASVGGA